jgi:hypothetical protein
MALSAPLLAAQLGQARVADPEVMRDLVEQRFLDRSGERGRIRVVGLERPTEERDLAGHRGAGGAVGRPWHALVEAEQAARADAGELLGRRLFVDDYGDAVEP